MAKPTFRKDAKNQLLVQIHVTVSSSVKSLVENLNKMRNESQFPFSNVAKSSNASAEHSELPTDPSFHFPLLTATFHHLQSN